MHLFYDLEWQLNISNSFADLDTINKFKEAITDHKKLELLNLQYICYLAVKGHIPVTKAAIIIPMLLHMCMIRYIAYDKIDRVSIQDIIPPVNVNPVLLIFNCYKQFDYCRQHLLWTLKPLSSAGDNDQGTELREGKIDANHIKKLLCALISPRFYLFHQWISYGKKNSNKIMGIISKPFAGIEKWLKYTHLTKDYQYIVPSTCVD
jgi:hypothetical protein